MSRATYKGELMFPSDYLSEADLKGKEVTLLIENVVPEDLRQKDNSEKACYIMTFKGTPKKFVVKPTNADLIIKATGVVESLDWVGHRITLYPTTCFAFGDPNTPCIRVKSKTNPEKKKPGAAPATEPSLPVTEQESSQPQAASGSVDKGELNWLNMVVESQDFTESNFDNAKAMYVQAQLPWQKKWDTMQGAGEYGPLLSAILKALQERGE